ncbi:MAG: manganese-dependent inorganic pyrophosphatase [Streptococcaceae bacterium]|jgi:manganese-dependent inorganic pyrophosphatase|nr:manganese-dependent inorganic pyrophosphatase [Streptococcaceae bacterium]
MKIFVTGHKNPDTDTISSAIAFANWMKEANNVDAEPIAQGEVNEETAFVLNYFNVKAPRIVTRATDEGVKNVILVDHNEFQQSIDDIEELTITGVVDHHRIANFQTADPLFYRAAPVGSAASIIARMYKEANITITKELAGLMLSALISDTLLLKSPTTHPTDHPIAKELAEIAGVDLETYGLEMLKAGTNLSSKTEAELIDLDAKTFPLNGKNVRVAQVNTVDIPEVMTRQEALEAAMVGSMNKDGYDDFVLIITDIVNSNSQLLAVGSHLDKVEAAFDVKLENHSAFLPGVVSRKKQVVPQLTESFA